MSITFVAARQTAKSVDEHSEAMILMKILRVKTARRMQYWCISTLAANT
jgi:hypothetical protein